jgi:hypothetical protein
MAKGSLTESVSNAVKECKPSSWWDALPKDVQGELIEIRKTFQSGGYQIKRLTLARILSEKCKERGLHTCATKGFVEWLQKN